MTNDTLTAALRARIVELVPEIGKPNCPRGGWTCNHYCSNCDNSIPRPITLADVLRAIVAVNTANKTNVSVEAGGFMQLRKWETIGHTFVGGANWHLEIPSLDDQPLPVKELIGRIIGCV